MPNPVLKGWKPSEIENPPVLPDDIPEKDEDIPDGRKAMDEILAQYGSREKDREQLMQSISKAAPKKKSGPTIPARTAAERNTRSAVGGNNSVRILQSSSSKAVL